MILLTLRTPRLELIAATAESATLEMRDIAAFASALHVVPPASWPPPLHDAGSQAWYLDLLQQDDAVGWGLWYLVVPQNERQLAGTVGFKGSRTMAHARWATVCCRNLKAADMPLKRRGA